MIKKLIAILILSFPSLVLSQVTNWQIVPQESSLKFTATQNGAPVSGKFTQFSGDIHFDPAQLKVSNVRIIVNMASITTDYADVGETLKTPDWFDSAKYPEAIFTASDFTKTGDKTYQVNGHLTIRSKILPVVMNFTMEEFTQTKARAVGTVMMKRLPFGVGQGEWQKTDNVKDEVQVDFLVNAIKK